MHVPAAGSFRWLRRFAVIIRWRSKIWNIPVMHPICFCKSGFSSAKEWSNFAAIFNSPFQLIEPYKKKTPIILINLFSNTWIAIIFFTLSPLMFYQMPNQNSSTHPSRVQISYTDYSLIPKKSHCTHKVPYKFIDFAMKILQSSLKPFFFYQQPNKTARKNREKKKETYTWNYISLMNI